MFAHVVQHVYLAVLLAGRSGRLTIVVACYAHMKPFIAILTLATGGYAGEMLKAAKVMGSINKNVSLDSVRRIRSFTSQDFRALSLPSNQIQVYVYVVVPLNEGTPI